MFNCERGCRKCFPNGCRELCKPPPQVQQQVDTKIHLEKAVVEKETPYGYVHIYPGVRTSDNNYTCPMISVHLYRHSQYTANIAQDKRSIIVSNNNEQQISQGPQQSKRGDTAAAEEEIIMLPLEDVTLISSKSEIKKGIQADRESEIQRVYDESETRCDRCYAGLLSCCSCCQKETKIAPLTTTTVFSGVDPHRSIRYEEEHLAAPEEKKDYYASCCNRFRCWCCRKKKLVGLIKRTKIVDERQAQRVITITIEYSKYSNLDSASNARLLSGEQQVAYYNKKFEPDAKLKFYLVNNTEYDASNFELKGKQAETLCRAVMQMKGMRNHYPSENELEKILDQPHKRTFGDVFDEPTLQLPPAPTTSVGDSQIHELRGALQQLAVQE